MSCRSDSASLTASNSTLVSRSSAFISLTCCRPNPPSSTAGAVAMAGGMPPPCLTWARTLSTISVRSSRHLLTCNSLSFVLRRHCFFSFANSAASSTSWLYIAFTSALSPFLPPASGDPSAAICSRRVWVSSSRSSTRAESSLNRPCQRSSWLRATAVASTTRCEGSYERWWRARSLGSTSGTVAVHPSTAAVSWTPSIGSWNRLSSAWASEFTASSSALSSCARLRALAGTPPRVDDCRRDEGV